MVAGSAPRTPRPNQVDFGTDCVQYFDPVAPTGSTGRFGTEPREEVIPAMDLSWRLRGACRGLDPEIFYSAGEDEGVERAKDVCGSCVVQQQCLEYALANRESEGIWGGATEKERRRILRQRRKTAAA